MKNTITLMTVSSFLALSVVMNANAQSAKEVITPANLGVSCSNWAKNMDAPDSKKTEFCTCLVGAVMASVPTQIELQTLATNFSIDALREFSQRPQGSQDFSACFS